MRRRGGRGAVPRGGQESDVNHEPDETSHLERRLRSGAILPRTDGNTLESGM